MIEHKNYKTRTHEAVNFVSLNAQEKDLVRLWRNHKDVRRWMLTDHLISVEEHVNFLKHLRASRRDSYWLIKESQSGRYVGVVSLNKLNTKHKNAYLGIYAGSQNRQKGDGHVLMDFLKMIAFEKIRLHTLKLETFETNVRAIKFFQREGFKMEGALKEFILRDGQYLDFIIMGCVNPRGRQR